MLYVPHVSADNSDPSCCAGFRETEHVLLRKTVLR